MINYNLPLSLPRNPGAINIPPQMDRKLYDKDPKFDIFKKSLPPPFFKKIVVGTHTPNTSDTFNIAKQSQLMPMTLPPDTQIGVYRNEWIQPLPTARFVQQPPTNGLTNAQVNILNSVDDPTKKYFLLEMFKGKIQITTSIKGKLTGITPADANILDQSLNRLLQKYTGLSNMNLLNDAELKKILDEYYFEIKPIYEKWKIANPGATFDPIQELSTGLISMVPTPAPAPPLAPAPLAVIGALIPAPVGAPSAPVGAPITAQPSAPPFTITKSDILIQDALNIVVNLGSAINAGDIKNKDKYFGELHQKIITMNPTELNEFNMLSSDMLINPAFVRDYVEYLTDNKQMTTSDIRDIYGATLSPGQTNDLDQFVAGATPATPTTPAIQRDAKTQLPINLLSQYPGIENFNDFKMNLIFNRPPTDTIVGDTDFDNFMDAVDPRKTIWNTDYTSLNPPPFKAVKDIGLWIIAQGRNKGLYKPLQLYTFVIQTELDKAPKNPKGKYKGKINARVKSRIYKDSVQTALDAVNLQAQSVGFGKKKKGKKTAMPKQYKAGGKQRTNRQQQLARLIKLL